MDAPDVYINKNDNPTAVDSLMLNGDAPRTNTQLDIPVIVFEPDSDHDENDNDPEKAALASEESSEGYDASELQRKKLGDSRSDLAAEDGEAAGTGRAAWGGKLEFIFTMIGYAVGLGNVWRFPYLAYKNGGGAFLVPYILMLATVGLPLFFMELSFGQFGSLGPITIWKINPLFKGLGYAMVSVSWLIAVYYNVIIAHVMYFLFSSIASIFTGIPWISCDNAWNTPACISPVYDDGNATFNATTNATAAVMNVADAFSHVAAASSNLTSKTPSEEYYYYNVLTMSPGMEDMGSVNWKLCGCLLFSWIIVLICLIRGIASLGKVVYFTAIFPYVMLTILLIRGATLPGALEGVKFYLTPDFSRLTDSRVWSDATTQIFYSLSVGSGGLIAMSSYNKFDNNCLKDALLVSIINCATSVYAGLVIFCVLGFMAVEKGVPVSEVAAGGPGLAFVVYPEALSRMPVPQLWSIFFFIMMATLGFGSQFSIVECVLSALTDEFPQWLRGPRESIIFRTGVIFLTFLLGIPMVMEGGIYLLNLVDYSVSGFPLLFVGILECVSISWIYGFNRFSDDLEMMLGRRPNLFWKFMWMAITPVVITITIISNCVEYKPPTYDTGEDEPYYYPGWALALGWLVTLFPMMLIVVFFGIRYCTDGGWLLLKEVVKPLPEWGPALPENRVGRYEEEDPLTPSVFSSGFYNFTFTSKNLGLPLAIKPHIFIPTPLSRSRTSVYIGGSRVDLRGSQKDLRTMGGGSKAGSRLDLVGTQQVGGGGAVTQPQQIHSTPVITPASTAGYTIQTLLGISHPVALQADANAQKRKREDGVNGHAEDGNNNTSTAENRQDTLWQAYESATAPKLTKREGDGAQQQQMELQPASMVANNILGQYFVPVSAAPSADDVHGQKTHAVTSVEYQNAAAALPNLQTSIPAMNIVQAVSAHQPQSSNTYTPSIAETAAQLAQLPMTTVVPAVQLKTLATSKPIEQN